MMQMFVEGLECARLCSDSGDKMAAERESEFGSHEGYRDSEVGGSENQLPTAVVV